MTRSHGELREALGAHALGQLDDPALPGGETFEMWVVGDDGTAYEAGEFVGVDGKKIVCDMSSSVLLQDAARFRVVDSEGTEVIAADVPS